MSSLAERRRRVARVAMAALAAALVGGAGVETAHATEVTIAAPAMSGAPLLAALRGGGHVLYFRHTSTDFGQNDEKMTGFEDCATQRNLTDAGRAEARAIGAAIRELGIPVGDVLASPFCRTRETATLMFGRMTVAPAVRGGPAQADAARYADLRILLSTRVPGGTNVAIASHGNPYHAVVGGPYLAEGEAAVIEPRGSEGFRVIARIRREEWSAFGAPR